MWTRNFLVALCIAGIHGVRFKRKRSVTATSSCQSIGCFADYNRSADCQCNKDCGKYDNCCSDFESLCNGASCAVIGCGGAYQPGQPCQCSDDCESYGNCCSDYNECSDTNPAPTPTSSPPSPPSPTVEPPEPGVWPPLSAAAERYWEGANMNTKGNVKQRITNGARKLSYGALWTFYKSGWRNLPGQPCQGGVFDVYSTKCWTPGNGQCGGSGYRKEGDCYNREHSWPKSWWDRVKNSAYSDVFHVVPSDGYVNGKRGSWPFGEVSSPTYTSNEGNKVGPCDTPGFSGTCFEPTDRVKGLMARGHLYMGVRYMGELSCCDKDAVNGAEMKEWTIALMLKWNAAFPPPAWESEFNNRAQGSQGNRNPFIDFSDLAGKLYR